MRLDAVLLLLFFARRRSWTCSFMMVFLALALSSAQCRLTLPNCETNRPWCVLSHQRPSRPAHLHLGGASGFASPKTLLKAFCSLFLKASVQLRPVLHPLRFRSCDKEAGEVVGLPDGSREHQEPQQPSALRLQAASCTGSSKARLGDDERMSKRTVRAWGRQVVGEVGRGGPQARRTERSSRTVTECMDSHRGAEHSP